MRSIGSCYSIKIMLAFLKRKAVLLSVPLVWFTVTATHALAAGSAGTLTNPLDSSISSIPAFFEAILQIVMIFAVPFVVFFIILAGFKYVKARGNASEIEDAHRALLYAVLGGLLILGAQAILTLVTNTVNQFTN